MAIPKCRCGKNADYMTMFIYNFDIDGKDREFLSLCKKCMQSEVINSAKSRTPLMTKFEILGKYKKED